MAKRIATSILALAFIACGSATATQTAPMPAEPRSDVYLTSGDGPDAVLVDRGGFASFGAVGDGGGPNLVP